MLLQIVEDKPAERLLADKMLRRRKLSPHALDEPGIVSVAVDFQPLDAGECLRPRHDLLDLQRRDVDLVAGC